MWAGGGGSVVTDTVPESINRRRIIWKRQREIVLGVHSKGALMGGDGGGALNRNRRGRGGERGGHTAWKLQRSRVLFPGCFFCSWAYRQDPRVSMKSEA